MYWSSVCRFVQNSNFMSVLKKLLLFIFILSMTDIEAQVLHHQMLSSQGTSVQLENGMRITQTIGQLSINGNLFNNYLRGTQGFQQAIINAFNSVGSDIKKLTAYPNPFLNSITIMFPISEKESNVSVVLYDLQGRLVYEQPHSITNQTIKINFETLPSSTYILFVFNDKIKYSLPIIKN